MEILSNNLTEISSFIIFALYIAVCILHAVVLVCTNKFLLYCIIYCVIIFIVLFISL